MSRGTGITTLIEFDQKLLLARASELANLGHLLKAEALLQGTDLRSASPEGLDLLARIHIKQGRFDDARKRWEQAIACDDHNRDKFRDCLRLLAKYSASHLQRRRIEWRLTLALLIAALAMGIWSLATMLLHK
ncbi:MAG: tetratricopeptide repeat protein [Verrucomicrobiaceae bacterium]|nr:tetratricopeptide repeat protein [Verrucomicrobiaceae bacterium]